VKLLPFDYAVRNLGRSPLRLVLSVGGAALVVLLVLAAGGFVNGMSRTLGTSGGEHNIIILGAGSEESVERSEILASVPGIVAASIHGIRTRASVPYLSPEVHVMLPVLVPGTANSDPANKAPAKQVVVRGVTPSATLVHASVRLTDGRWPRSGEDEVLVGANTHTVMGVRQLPLASTLNVDGRPWTIVGRFDARGTVVDAEIWMPLEDVKTATKRETISCVIITIDPYNEETGEGTEFADIAAFAMTRPDLELAVLSEHEYYGRLAAFFGPIRLVAWFTAGLIALGGLFGGLNTLYATFAARIRELGTLQALGFRRGPIVLSMVQEATLATAAGGLLGCAVGIFVLDGVAVRFSMGAFGLIIDHVVISIGLACGLALGIVGALPPAIRCLRPTIPEALKAV
jgi:putative ABC transport system permease protein